MSGGHLLSNSSDGVVDHDVFVFASSSPQALTTPVNITAHIHDRIQHGALLVCFVETDILAWLPNHSQNAQVQTRSHSGRDVVAIGSGLVFDGLSKLVVADSAFSLELMPLGHAPAMWQTLIAAKDGKAVAATYTHGSGRVLLLPPMAKTRGRVVRHILDTLLPDLAPDLHSRRGSSAKEQAPGWASAVPVPGADLISARIASLDKQLAQLQGERSEEQVRLDALLAYRDILWLGGYGLEKSVKAALELLGIRAERKGPLTPSTKYRTGGSST